MIDFEALAKRCELASEPDRHLDDDIRAAVKWQGLNIFGNWKSPRYTASLDDAMMLVPPDAEWIIARSHDRLDGNKPHFYASIDESQVHYGASPALALCAASLRARAAIDGAAS